MNDAVDIITNRLEAILAPYVNFSFEFLMTYMCDKVKIEELEAFARGSGEMFILSTLIAPALVYCAFFSVARLVLGAFVFKPLALFAMDIKKDVIDMKRIASIDEALPPPKRKGQTIDDKQVETACKQLKMETAAVQQYLWKRRRSIVAQNKVVKFVETIWRDILYCSSVAYGSYLLFYPEYAAWVKDPRHYWIGWPYQDNNRLHVYYKFGLGSYFHQLLWTEVSRSDSAEMILHHFTTIALMVSSYAVNFTRIGTSILILHDVSDVFLETAKLLHYASMPKVHKWLERPTEVFFAIFTISFFCTRLYVFPRYVIWPSIIARPDLEGSYGVCGDDCWFYMFIPQVVAQVVLLCLHVFWFSLILKMLYKMFMGVRPQGDERSDDDDEEEEGGEGEGEWEEKKKEGEGEEKKKKN